jgi:membrane-associated phospholipid phosphatase
MFNKSHFILSKLTNLKNDIRFILFLSFFLVLLNPNVCYSQTKGIETAGDVLLVGLPLTALTTSLILKDKEGTEQFAKAFLVNKLITFSLKGLIGKERPDGVGYDSFPSGHTSTTFQSASFIQKRYGWKYGIPAYALASFTAYSRINADRHDLTDVLFGAAIGIGSSYLFTTPFEKQNTQVFISGGLNNVMVGFSYRF